MIRWLKGLADREEVSGRVTAAQCNACFALSSQQTVNIVQVVEHLTSKGVAKEEALEVSVLLSLSLSL